MYYNFSTNLPEPFNRIHPYQLPAVMKLVEGGFPEDVERIMLFGGSLDLACNMQSDLDLYVITENPERETVYDAVYKRCLKLKKRFDIFVSNHADFLDAQTERGTIEFEIKQKGICIYAKEKSNVA